MAIIVERCIEVGATLLREGLEFGVTSRVPAVGGQVLGLQGMRGELRGGVPPALRRPPGAERDARARRGRGVRRRRGPAGRRARGAGFAEVTSPGRLEIIRRSPTIVLDAAHNPHGAAAAVAALEDSFTFSPLIGVIGGDGRQGLRGVLSEFEPALAHVVCTQNSTRPLDAGLGAGRGRPRDLRPRPGQRDRSLADAIDQAAALAEAAGSSARPSARAGCSSPARW